MNISQVSYQPNNISNANFKGKFNVRNKCTFDTSIIDSFVPKGRCEVLLNLSKRVLHSMPTEEEMSEYYNTR